MYIIITYRASLSSGNLVAFTYSPSMRTSFSLVAFVAATVVTARPQGPIQNITSTTTATPINTITLGSETSSTAALSTLHFNCFIVCPNDTRTATATDDGICHCWSQVNKYTCYGELYNVAFSKKNTLLTEVNKSFMELIYAVACPNALVKGSVLIISAGSASWLNCPVVHT